MPPLARGPGAGPSPSGPAARPRVTAYHGHPQGTLCGRQAVLRDARPEDERKGAKVVGGKVAVCPRHGLIRDELYVGN